MIKYSINLSVIIFGIIFLFLKFRINKNKYNRRGVNVFYSKTIFYYSKTSFYYLLCLKVFSNIRSPYYM